MRAVVALVDVRAHNLDDLVARGMRLLLEQVGRAHDLAGLAIATLLYFFASQASCIGCEEFAERPSMVGKPTCRIPRSLASGKRMRCGRQRGLRRRQQAGATSKFRAAELKALPDYPRSGVVGGVSVDAVFPFTGELDH